MNRTGRAAIAAASALALIWLAAPRAFAGESREDGPPEKGRMERGDIQRGGPERGGDWRGQGPRGPWSDEGLRDQSPRGPRGPQDLEERKDGDRPDREAIAERLRDRAMQERRELQKQQGQRPPRGLEGRQGPSERDRQAPRGWFRGDTWKPAIPQGWNDAQRGAIAERLRERIQRIPQSAREWQSRGLADRGAIFERLRERAIRERLGQKCPQAFQGRQGFPGRDIRADRGPGVSRPNFAPQRPGQALGRQWGYKAPSPRTHAFAPGAHGGYGFGRGQGPAPFAPQGFGQRGGVERFAPQYARPWR